MAPVAPTSLHEIISEVWQRCALACHNFLTVEKRAVICKHGFRLSRTTTETEAVITWRGSEHISDLVLRHSPVNSMI
jgi:hypothetical protein